MAVNQEEPPVRAFPPVWPDLASIDQARVAFASWREVDTLFVSFAGEAPPAVSVPLDRGGGAREYSYLLVDPPSGAVGGLQIEEFLGDAGRRHPRLLDLLDLAELHGIAPAEIAELRRTVGTTPRKRAAVAALFDELAPPSASPGWSGGASPPERAGLGSGWGDPAPRGANRREGDGRRQV